MVRRRSIGWLLALTAVVGLGLVVFIAVPIRSCPTCRSLAKKLVDPVTKTVPFRVNCPACGGPGTVTGLLRLKGSLVTQPVSRLLQSQRESRQQEFVLKLDEVASAAGKIPGEVSGESFYPAERSGNGFFVQAAGKWLVLIILRGTLQPLGFSSMPVRGKSSAGLVLLGMDGRVLDYLHCSCDSIWGSMIPEILDGAPDGAVVAIHARNETGDDRDLRYANVTAHQPGGSKEFPNQVNAVKICRIAVKDERFDILTPPTPAKR